MVLKLLFANRENRHVGQFVEFLKDAQAQGHVKSLNKDQWDVFYEFSRTMDDTFTGYSDTAAWPSLFDEYVEWRQKKVCISFSVERLTIELRDSWLGLYLWIVMGAFGWRIPLHSWVRFSNDGMVSGIVRWVLFRCHTWRIVHLSMVIKHINEIQ